MSAQWVVLLDGRVEITPGDHAHARRYAAAARRIQPGASVEVVEVTTTDGVIRRKLARQGA